MSRDKPCRTDGLLTFPDGFSPLTQNAPLTNAKICDIIGGKENDDEEGILSRSHFREQPSGARLHGMT